MGWWKADPEPEVKTSQPPPQTKLPPPPSASQPQTQDPASACPVDHKTRELWLQQAKAKSQAAQLPASHPPIPTKPTSATLPTTFGSSKECSSDRIDQTPTTSTPSPYLKKPLSHDRAISSIPRATPTPTTNNKTEPSLPANSETETGHHSSGNWIYPSESQFFNAVMRKQTSSNPSDLASSISHIIPIHNAVNERAWTLIKDWEGSSSASCGGPKLASFRGLGAGALSPKARLKSLWGYTEPFDRHDWVVERCGGDTVEYIIDFYQGKQDASKPGSLNFYLDVRPKLNSFEGCKMRAERWVGWR